jgi:Cupin-like domain
VKTIAIDRIPLASAEAAERIRRCEPFVTRVSWPAHQRWDLDYVVQRCGAKQVTIFRKQPDGPARKLEVSLGEYLDIVADPDWGASYELLGVPQTRLWFQGEPDPALGSLLDDIDVPEAVDRSRLQSINLWLQGGRFENPNHYDPNGLHNLNVQVRGRKRWRLFDPDQGGVLGVVPALADIGPPLLSWEALHPDRCADRPGHEHAICREAVLEPGEAIFVPAFTMHWVAHVDDLHMNVNFWWAPQSVPMAGIPVAWALLNGLIRVFRRRTPDASLSEICAAIAGMSDETRELLLELEQTFLGEPEVLDPVHAMWLRHGAAARRPLEGVEDKLRDRS